MKVELKHLAPYLPYKLKLKDCLLNLNHHYLCADEKEANKIDGFTVNEVININHLIPILRPLSDLTKEQLRELKLQSKTNGIENYGDLWCSGAITVEDMLYISEKLFEWHFDVFGLIEKGLAIDINTLNN